MSDYLANAESQLGATKASVQPYLQAGGFGQLAAWCAAFLSSSLAQAGYSVAPGNANVASNYLNYGTPDPTLQYGDVAINTNSYLGGGTVSPGEVGAHVGFVDSVNPRWFREHHCRKHKRPSRYDKQCPAGRIMAICDASRIATWRLNREPLSGWAIPSDDEEIVRSMSDQLWIALSRT